MGTRPRSVQRRRIVQLPFEGPDQAVELTSCDGPALGAPDSGFNCVFTNRCHSAISITPSTGGVTDVLAVGEATTRQGLDEFVGQSTYLIARADGTGELEGRPGSAEVEVSGDLCPDGCMA
jgi:hypothetical protein